MELWRTKELLFVILSLTGLSRSQTLKQNTWRRLPSQYIGLQYIQRTLKISDQSSCALNCMFYGSCSNFYFNPQTTDCTQGGWLVTTTTARSPPSDIYANGYYCDVVANYIIHGNVNGSVCVYRSDTMMNFTSALSTCREKNAELYKVENLGKFWMLKSVSDVLLTKDVWVGVDDLDQDKAFRQTHNNWPLGTNFESQIFVPGYNNNTNGGQNCGLFSKNDSRLFSVPCNTSQYFLCEMFAAPFF